MNEFSEYQPFYSSASFTLARKNRSESSEHLMMQVHGNIVNTRGLPQTFLYLSTVCPSVLNTECFNYDKLPFREEVKRTEIGHLFEHLLLTFYCKERIKVGVPFISVDGKTSWNWKRDPWGLFHIYLPTISFDNYTSDPALYQAIEITEKLLTFKAKKTVRDMSSAPAILH